MRKASSDSAAERHGILNKIRAEVLGVRLAELQASGFVTREIYSWKERIGALHPRSIVDIGCGNGRLGIWLASRSGCTDYFGVDIDPATLSSARDAPIPAWLGVRYQLADFEAPYRCAVGRADIAIAFDSLYLAKDLWRAMRAAASYVKQDGHILMTAYVGRDVFEGGVRNRTVEDWRAALCKGGFSVIAVDDISKNWRLYASRIHRKRLARSKEILAELGLFRGLQTLKISSRMLGLDGRAGFLKSASRVQFFARLDGGRR